MVLYHPDRYPDNKEYEEKAKRINESYEKLYRGQAKDSFFTVGQSANHVNARAAGRAKNVRGIRRVPAFILALAIFACIISLWLFLSI
jgi:DnaJ-class molecular chaperone